jgi:hypothetical protein
MMDDSDRPSTLLADHVDHNGPLSRFSLHIAVMIVNVKVDVQQRSITRSCANRRPIRTGRKCCVEASNA